MTGGGGGGGIRELRSGVDRFLSLFFFICLSLYLSLCSHRGQIACHEWQSRRLENRVSVCMNAHAQGTGPQSIEPVNKTEQAGYCSLLFV